MWSASNKRYEVQRTELKFRERAFSFAGPSAWNSLPAHRLFIFLDLDFVRYGQLAFF